MVGASVNNAPAVDLMPRLLRQLIVGRGLPSAYIGRAVVLWETMVGKPLTVPSANFVDLRHLSRLFSEMAVVSPNAGFTLGSSEESNRDQSLAAALVVLRARCAAASDSG